MNSVEIKNYCVIGFFSSATVLIVIGIGLALRSFL